MVVEANGPKRGGKAKRGGEQIGDQKPGPNERTHEKRGEKQRDCANPEEKTHRIDLFAQAVERGIHKGV